MQTTGSLSSIPNMREVTVVEIKNPVNHEKKNGRKYTDFEICLKSNSKAFTIGKSSVRRRYSDFVWLRNWLSENNEGFSSTRKTPSLPPKKLIGRFEEEFIEDRMKGLQRFLRKVIEHNVFLSDKALHLFLQSNLGVRQIENYLTGKPVEDHDCVTTKKIMDGLGNGDEHSHGDNGTIPFPSSLENISSLQRIAEDNENCSSLESDDVLSNKSRNSLPESDLFRKKAKRKRPSVTEKKDEHTYESFPSMTQSVVVVGPRKSEVDVSFRRSSSSSSKSNGSLKECSSKPNEKDSEKIEKPNTSTNSTPIGVIETDSNSTVIPNDPAAVGLSCPKEASYSKRVDNYPSDTGTENSDQDLDTTNSSFALVGSASTGSPLTCSQSLESLSIGSSPDALDRGLIPAVPIVRSASP